MLFLHTPARLTTNTSHPYIVINELELANLSSQILCLSSVILVSDSATSKDFDEIVNKISQEWVANSSVMIVFAQLSNAEGSTKTGSQSMRRQSKISLVVQHSARP